LDVGVGFLVLTSNDLVNKGILLLTFFVCINLKKIEVTILNILARNRSVSFACYIIAVTDNAIDINP